MNNAIISYLCIELNKWHDLRINRVKLDGKLKLKLFAI
jgi:hypothetical protein